jgi:hypothetical protein
MATQLIYPVVEIMNATAFKASGTVEYLGKNICGSDSYSVESGGTWKARGRGACLVTRITATLNTPEGPTAATPYVSSGTSFSQFSIVFTGESSFAVIRPSNGAEDLPPEGYVEPATKQK